MERRQKEKVREGGWGGGGEEEEEGMFNLLLQFLPILVTLLLCKGGQMEHAAQSTQTKSHFLSTSQSLSHLHVSLLLHLSLCLSASLPHFFSRFVVYLLAHSHSQYQPCENEKSSSIYLTEFVTR